MGREFWSSERKERRKLQNNPEETNTIRRESEENAITITKTQTGKTEQVKKKIKTLKHKR